MRAIVLGASGGIGAAICAELVGRGAEVTPISRRMDGLDLGDQASISRVAAAQTGEFDLIFNATGALSPEGHAPEKTIAAIQASAMAAQFEVNATGPALLLRYFSPLLRRNGRCVFASLSARVGSIGDNRLGGWIGYRAAKAAHNQIIRTAAIEIARKRPEAIIVALHPGTVATRLSSDYTARHPAITAQQSARALLGVIDRLEPEDTGSFHDWRGERVVW